MNLQINSQQCIGLSGASGSGKSKLLRAIADLDVHQGEVLLDDQRQQDVPAHEWRSKVALLPAETHWWHDRVGDHFKTLSVEQLAQLGLNEKAVEWSVPRLSSGEKQRLGLLRLLQNQPQVLLLDEPTANLDNQNTLLFEQFVLDYLTCQSACAIWVSHDQQQLQRISHQRLEIRQGQLHVC